MASSATFLNALAAAAVTSLAQSGNISVGLCDSHTVDVNGAITVIGEPSGGGYARVTVATSTLTTAYADGESVITANNPVNFPTATATWGTLSQFVIFKNNVAMMVYPMSETIDVQIGTDVGFPAGMLQIPIGG